MFYRYKSFKFTLGGSSLNSCRILSALGERNLLFFGAIGNDTNGKVVKEILKISSVNVWYVQDQYTVVLHPQYIILLHFNLFVYF